MSKVKKSCLSMKSVLNVLSELKIKRISRLFLVLIIFLSIPSYVFGTEEKNVVNSIDVSEFIGEIKGYSNELFPELSDENWLNNILSGEMNISGQSIIKRILNLFLKEFKDNISLLLKIIGIAVLCSVLKNIQNSYGGSVSEIAFYVCYMLIIILIITSFTNITNICVKAISKLNNFMSIIIPVLITLLVAMGNLSLVATTQPVLLGMISIISMLISKLVIPITLISTILSLVSNISSQVNVEKIGKFFRKAGMYILEFSMIIFVGILSLEGTLSAGVDGITSKITKTAISNAVPVVGKLISDTADSVIGSIGITKNAVGIIGILVILVITVTPILKTFILMTIFNLGHAICDSIADSRISKCMAVASDSIKAIFGIMVMVLFLFIIAITLMIKMSNFSLMYR